MAVRPGATDPRRWHYVDGATVVPESMITGEARAVRRGVSTVTTDHALRVRVDAVGEDTALARDQRPADESQCPGHVVVLRFASAVSRPVSGGSSLARDAPGSGTWAYCPCDPM